MVNVLPCDSTYPTKTRQSSPFDAVLILNAWKNIHRQRLHNRQPHDQARLPTGQPHTASGMTSVSFRHSGLVQSRWEVSSACGCLGDGNLDVVAS
jgi:hypothetical protein